MAIPPYTLGYPPDGNSLGQTKTTIRNNLDGTFLTLETDHVNNNGVPGANPPGYHTLIHQVSQTNVTTLANYNQVFSGVPGALIVNGVTTPNLPTNGDTQLYALTAMGGLSQLTGNSAAAIGFQWIGGVLLQWGLVSAVPSMTSTTVTFAGAPPGGLNAQAFPNNAFIFIANVMNPGSDAVLSITGLTKTGLTIFNTSSQTRSFYWFAIGN